MKPKKSINLQWQTERLAFRGEDEINENPEPEIRIITARIVKAATKNESKKNKKATVKLSTHEEHQLKLDSFCSAALSLSPSPGLAQCQLPLIDLSGGLQRLRATQLSLMMNSSKADGAGRRAEASAKKSL